LQDYSVLRINMCDHNTEYKDVYSLVVIFS